MKLPKCSAEMGNIKAIYFFKAPSKYMIKKYGFDKAYEMALKKPIRV